MKIQFPLYPTEGQTHTHADNGVRYKFVGGRWKSDTTATGSTGTGGDTPTSGVTQTQVDQTVAAAISAVASPKDATNITFDAQSRLSGYTANGKVYALTYGTDGLTSVTRDGAAYMTLSYTNGKLSSVDYA